MATSRSGTGAGMARKGNQCFRLMAILGIIALAVTACGGNGGEPGKGGKVTVRLALLAEGYDVPTFYAAEKGYFKDEGLDVDIKESTGSSTTTKLVGNGQADLGFADLPTVAKGIAQGVPIKAVGAVFQTTPLATIYLEGRGIDTPADLKGKTIGEQPGSATSQYLPAFLANSGLKETDIKSVNIDAGAREKLLLSGKIDAFNSYAVENVPVLDIRYKAKANAFTWGDSGLDMLGLGIIVSDRMIKDSPDVARKFLAAYAKGYVAAVAHPKDAAQSVLNKFGNSAGGSLPTIEKQWELSQSLQHTTSTEGKPLLWMSAESWKGTLATNAKYSDIKTHKPLGDFYSNKLLADVTKPDAPRG